MNLEFDADTEELIDRARGVFERAAPIERFRRGADQGPTWRALHAAGWASLGSDLVAGAIELDAAVGVYREAGRQLLGEALVTGGYLIPALLAHVDGPTDELAAPLRQAPGVLLGDGRADSYAVGAADSGFCFGTGPGDQPGPVYRLNRDGTGTLVLELLTGGSVRTEPVAGLSPAMGTVTATGGSWHRRPLRLDGDGLAEIRRTELLLHSATLLGCAEAVLTATRDYTLARVQFGVAIARFQAVQHALADVLAANEVAWSAVLHAVAATDDRAYRTDVARLLVVEAALAAARVAAQFHGGIGFTTEADVHHFLKAILDGSCRFGSTDRFAARIGRALVAAC